MRRLLLLLTVAVAGCTYNYSASALNAVSLGATKQDFVRQYTRQAMQSPVPRASKIVAGDTVEVLTLPIRGLDRRDVDYWFVFKNNRLIQWGKPEDWQQVAATYQIEYNPSSAVRSP